MPQTAGKLHFVQSLIEVISKGQRDKFTWELNLFQWLVEVGSKNQAVETWKDHTVQRLIKWISKSQLLQTAGKLHFLQAPIERFPKRQFPKLAGQFQPVHAHVVPVSQGQGL